MPYQDKAYNAFVQLVMHAENISWNRFYNYLMAMTFLILAWATIYVADSDLPMIKVILISISILGFLSGLFWAALGYRGRCFLFEYAKKGSEIEKDTTIWSENNFKPLTYSIELRDNLPFGFFGSRFILVTVPILISILYAILFFASVCDQ